MYKKNGYNFTLYKEKLEISRGKIAKYFFSNCFSAVSSTFAGRGKMAEIFDNKIVDVSF